MIGYIQIPLIELRKNRKACEIEYVVSEGLQLSPTTLQSYSERKDTGLFVAAVSKFQLVIEA
jgi:hypothetical protein